MSAHPGIYYPKQLEDALQHQIEINGKYHNGNALTVALMYAEPDVMSMFAFWQPGDITKDSSDEDEHLVSNAPLDPNRLK